MDGSNISRKAPSQLICYSKISNVWYFIQCITQCCKHTLKLDNEIYAGRKTMRKGWRGVKTQTALHFPFLLKKIGKKRDIVAWSHSHWCPWKDNEARFCSSW